LSRTASNISLTTWDTVFSTGLCPWSKPVSHDSNGGTAENKKPQSPEIRQLSPWGGRANFGSVSGRISALMKKIYLFSSKPAGNRCLFLEYRIKDSRSGSCLATDGRFTLHSFCNRSTRCFSIYAGHPQVCLSNLDEVIATVFVVFEGALASLKYLTAASSSRQ